VAARSRRWLAVLAVPAVLALAALFFAVGLPIGYLVGLLLGLVF
jgi:hypothetical protein